MGCSKWSRDFVKKYKTVGNLKKITKDVKRKDKKIIKKALK